MIKIFHNSDFLSYWRNPVLSKNNLKFAGLIDTNDFNEAYHLSQNIDSNWTDGKKVLDNNGHARSTAVGDLMIKIDDNTKEITAQTVESCGFKVVTLDNFTF